MIFYLDERFVRLGRIVASCIDNLCQQTLTMTGLQVAAVLNNANCALFNDVMKQEN